MEAGTERSRGPIRRLTTETKQAFKTTEFWAVMVTAIAILIAGAAVTANGPGGNDLFSADKAWLYVAILISAYAISRGLAKAGSRDPYWDDPSAGADAGPLTERVKSAAAVLKEGEGATSGNSESGHPSGIR